MPDQPNLILYRQSLKWRYLDSLDSTRYSPKEYIDEGASVPQRFKQAQIELAATMLMGNGIVVPNNQLMDSYGFIHSISSMIEKANEYLNNKKEIFVPIKWARYSYKLGKKAEDPFFLVASLFDKDGKEDHGYFELSAYQNLANKRREFAKILRDHNSPPSSFFESIFDQELVAELYTILNFFDLNKTYQIIDAASTGNVRDDLHKSIADLSEQKIEADPFFKKMYENNTLDQINQKIESVKAIVTVFNRLKTDMDPNSSSDRTAIRKELVEKPEKYLSKLPGLPVTIRKGVLKTVDTIYNFSGFISTKAEQDHQTEPMDSDDIWGVDEAAFALGQYARYQSKKKSNGVSSINDISSPQDTFVDPKIVVISGVERKNVWDKFFYHQRHDKWVTSLTNYMNSLRSFENARKNYFDDKELQNSKNLTHLEEMKTRYQKCRKEHIDNVNEILGTDRYKIVEEDEKAVLICKNRKDEVVSKIKIEDFSENTHLTNEEISAVYSGEITNKETTIKGITDEFGDNVETKTHE